MNVNLINVYARFNETDVEYLKNVVSCTSIFFDMPCLESEDAFFEFCKKALKERDEKLAYEKESKEKAAAREKQNAFNKGMTVEQYREWKKEHSKMKRYDNKVKQLNEEIAKLIEERNYYLKKSREYHEKMRED